MEYITGWVLVFGLIITSFLVVLNTVNPLQGERRLWIHCAIGKVMILATFAHLLSMPFEGFNDIAIWSTAVLIFITIATGLLLMYLPDLGKTRYYMRSVHSVLIIAIIISVIRHAMVTLKIL
ncbi:hypothetical protein HN807_06940 [Candidatus Bathyarchaeota archaeon]|jgi:heme/copper-type cytochrome/quinol oxidase subunit 4|nr:hypothetical protein [Candidatus Bathyarchaeota archaeon]MBT4321451.1 hypothetical protein [Candidatus Bathyarchaeota archaeon]MBT4424206.1 hypothetical protein [Candidatus Bathyarchaeota archaeon]MBT6605575.1 hypothetical protein [Candidatus Bathyarchaeota archaeon]MBT7187594.1 hypothetical protein [Candidatus Bathyarchaeota archaeon]